MTTSMTEHLTKLNDTVELVCKTWVDAKLMPQQNRPAVIDAALSDEDMNAKLRGSIVRTVTGTTAAYWVVPGAGSVFTSGSSAKLNVSDNWTTAAKMKKMDTFGTIDAVVLGVMTFPASAGARAAKLKLGTLDATLTPATGTTDAISSVNVNVAGSTATKGVEEAILALGLE